MPNITNTRLTELESKEKLFNDLKEREHLKALAENFSQSLGTIAANTPYEEWPEVFKETFESLYFPWGVKGLYLDNLPQKKV